LRSVVSLTWPVSPITVFAVLIFLPCYVPFQIFSFLLFPSQTMGFFYLKIQSVLAVVLSWWGQTLCGMLLFKILIATPHTQHIQHHGKIRHSYPLNTGAVMWLALTSKM
jgi:hypothetical protein